MPNPTGSNGLGSDVSRRDQVIWAAGFFDGEGCIRIDGGLGCAKAYYTLRVSATQVSREPLDLLVELWGGSIHLDATGRTRAVHRWVACANEALASIEEMLPFLIVKRAQAEVGIRFQLRRRGVPRNTSARRRLLVEPLNERDKQEIGALKAVA